MPLSKQEFAQILSTLPADASPEQIDAAVKAKEGQGGIKGVWERLNTPLTTLPSKLATKAADVIDQRHLDESPMMARVKGFLAGATQGAGDFASSMTSPVNLATMAAGAGATGAAKAGLTGLSRGARVAEAALQAPMIAQGANQMANGQGPVEKGMGVAQLAGGLAGVGSAFKRPALGGSLFEQTKANPRLNNEVGKIDLTGEKGISAPAQELAKPGPIFYNKALKVMERVPEGAKLPPNKFRDLLLGNGVTKDFFDTMELPQLFEGKKSVRKEEVVAQLKKLDPQFHEVALGRPTGAREAARDRYNRFLDTVVQESGVPREHLDEYVRRYADSFESFSDMPDEVRNSVRGRVLGPRLEELANLVDKAEHADTAPTQYGSYTTKGPKENYTELLMQLPNRPEWNDQPHFGSNVPGHANTMAHMRFDTRNIGGKKTLYVEEIQSDLHQRGKENGYDSPERRQKLAQLKDEYEKTVAIQNELRKPTVDALKDMGQLGFNTGISALRAVFDHPDYATRWDVDPKYVPLLDQYRKGYLRMGEITDEMNKLHDGTTPNYPFKHNWHEVMMKRAIREAADQGAEQLAWTTGKEQADRYGLEKHFKELRYEPDTNSHGVTSGNLRGVQLDGTPYARYVEPQELAELVGQDLAKRLLTTTDEPRFNITLVDPSGKRTPQFYQGHPQDVVDGFRQHYPGWDIQVEPGTPWKQHPTLTGDDLKYGGEGMRSFYDELLPGFFNKYAKKYGSKAEMRSGGYLDADPPTSMWTAPLTPELRKLALEGQELGKIPLPLLLAMAGGSALATGLPPLIANFLKGRKQQDKK